MTTTTIVNTKDEGDLAITKTLSSTAQMDQEKTFRFEVTLKDGTGTDATAVSGIYTGTLRTTVGSVERTYTRDVEFKSGKATIDLKPGETMTLSGIPVG